VGHVPSNQPAIKRSRCAIDRGSWSPVSRPSFAREGRGVSLPLWWHFLPQTLVYSHLGVANKFHLLPALAGGGSSTLSLS
jgi:hypothetical protein